MKDLIESITGQKVQTMQAIGSSFGAVYRVQLNDSRQIVVKSGTDNLDIEGRMLLYLRQYSQLPVPEVLHTEPKLLIMTYLENSGGLNKSAQEDAAIHLAALHSISSENFGLDFDTLIGALHQPNPFYDSWIDFFREQRLLYMAKEAHIEGQLPLKSLNQIENFAQALENFINEPKHPSLIHGDMWTGNVLALNGKIAGFIDPAIYYAHPEIELAFSTLFSTFGDSFFAAYNAISPIEVGFFEERRDIYNLYPLLVHLRLFGTSYLGQIESILRKFGF